jgi:hypothetical protein
VKPDDPGVSVLTVGCLKLARSIVPAAFVVTDIGAVVAVAGINGLKSKGLVEFAPITPNATPEAPVTAVEK